MADIAQVPHGESAAGRARQTHFVEFIVYRSLFQRAGGPMLQHFVQTMIYGLFYWTPIKKRLEEEAAS